jgi:hypothetical protein
MDRLMVCLAQFGEKGVTKQYHSELRAQVCAIELLFPKPSRDKLRPRFLTGEVSASEIATKARIPTHFVRAAMEEWYHDAAAASYERLAQKAASPKLNLSENDNESAAAE